jgi:carbon monoxide dehydrogenase subunit G
MKKLCLLLTTCLAVFAIDAAYAHGPTRQKVTESVTIEASTEKVWAMIKDFDALSKWHPAVEKSPADKGNDEGSIRQLSLKGGGALTEALEGYNADAKKYNYRAKDGGALPVTNYTSTIQVKGDGSKAIVEWRGAFYRQYTNNDPPKGQDDEAAITAITGVYKSGLANLKKLAEQK